MRVQRSWRFADNSSHSWRDVMSSCVRDLPALAAILAFVASVSAQGPTPATRATAMQSHYVDAIRVHDAIVRGDLPGAHDAARHLRTHAEPGMPEKVSSYVEAMRQAAVRVSEAPDLAAACSSAATMLGTCGDCHRAVGALPAVAARPVPAVGQTVGHMLNHQHATEQLLQGLVEPSSTAWNEGAQALRTAPIARGKLPRDSKLTSELIEGEQRLHQLADRAAGAAATTDRIAVYGEMIGTCAACHSLHPNVWGPGKR
jgi:hypothetical protein